MASLRELPESLAVLGGGVIAVEYATVLAELGVPTSILCSEEGFLSFLPQELRDAIKAAMVRLTRMMRRFIYHPRSSTSPTLARTCR